MAIKRRTSKYVQMQPDGTLSIRTPSACTKWVNDFRLRIVRDYIAPNTMSDANHVAKLSTKAVYKVHGRKLQIDYIFKPLENMPSKVIVTDMLLKDLSEKKALALHHEDAAMRVLMVYCFIYDEKFAGVPALDIRDC